LVFHVHNKILSKGGNECLQNVGCGVEGTTAVKKKKKKKKKDLLTITKVIPKISKRAHAYFQVLNLDRNLQENTNILLYCKTI